MEPDEPQVLQYTPRHSNSFKRPRRSLQSSTPLGSVSEGATPSPRLSGQTQLTPEVIEHINALKHLDNQQVILLLEAARNGGEQLRIPSSLGALTTRVDRIRMPGPDRSSMSTLASSRSSYLSVPSSRVTSILSDPRSSVASTDSSFTHYSAASRLSTASSRLSTLSVTSAPKNFACTFCDKALKSKPYWKSHEEEFHEQRLTWRCPDCQQIFHAGKRFREHHTKLHNCEDCKQPRESGQPTSRKASPCVKKYEIVMHDKDAWGCGFCAALLTTWEERCEHIALHFEEKRCKWNFTNVIVGLLKQAEVSQAWQSLLTQRHGDEQNWPQFTWESKKCNRLRYKLEVKWDTRMFDIEALVQETYDLAETEGIANEVTERIEKVEPTDTAEITDCKVEMFDFPSAPTVASSQEIPPETHMMDLDPEPVQSMPQPEVQQTHWPVPPDMSQNVMNPAVSMDAFNGYAANAMHTMSTNYTQHTHSVSHSYHQPSWPEAGFASTPDLLNFQAQGNYMDYAPAAKEVIVPTSQFANFGRPTSQHSQHQFVRPGSQQSAHAGFGHYPRQSMPASFMPQITGANARRFTPKLVHIAATSQRISPGEKGPPPPPKDEHRFAKPMNLMRRRGSNNSQLSQISQQTMVPQQRDMGWNDEYNWG
ncbi:hypothetical protein M011DRAFT_475664 [Sporormia fimetaria CBS 119925]|uniref:C2H2-type domain-containing protein n=1 Tax=Sporormia fimetaria CBS 119925 TaxID=1340428 RepID=A0A6A6VIR0_9PLEO|nr:hypothetical protein M011DRAFT_475664 [Sporormia fimetaria CBS 119925]